MTPHGHVCCATCSYNENDKLMEEGSLVLVDAAAELGGTRVGGGYASDITRTWPCSGTFTETQVRRFLSLAGSLPRSHADVTMVTL